MTYYLISVTAIIIGYISGSINYAILVTKAVRGEDIRELGNKNPGTSNVLRTVGKFWGIVVGVLDGLKGFLPILVFRIVFFKTDTNADFSVLYSIGIAAVFGHCFSIFYNFSGGGGIGTMFGVSLFFIPVEFLGSMLLGGAIVMVFFKNTDKKFGQKAPIFFVTLTPFSVLATALLMDIPLFAHISIGGHLKSTVVCSFILSLLLLAINAKFLKTKIRRR